ncbi:Protein yif1b [Tritrichomonas musculus]|uniref:Protein YIF1 n=1 Tax=Tritrichomonas musculus TaxID=1915356 RepID=A0ABR2IZF8_9EUKA
MKMERFKSISIKFILKELKQLFISGQILMDQPMFGDQMQSGNPQPQNDSSATVLDPTRYIQTANTAAKLIANNVNIDDIKNRFSQSESFIRPLFAVNYKSVLAKIKCLACPFIVKNWSRSVPDGEPAIPITNPNLPELYTPLVSFYTFLLLSSIYRGMNHEFSFESLSYLFAKSGGILLFLVMLSKLLFFLVKMPNSYPLFSLISDLSIFGFYTSIINLSVCIIPSLRFLVLIYSLAASFLWSIRTLNPRSGIQSVRPSPSHTYTIVIVALLEALTPFLLSEKVIKQNSPVIPAHVLDVNSTA